MATAHTMSCWVSEHSVRVPSFHNTGGKMFFAIELTKRVVASSPSAQLSRSSFQSSSGDRHFITYRSYSQFRALWKTLAGQTTRRSDDDDTSRPPQADNVLRRLQSRLAARHTGNHGVCVCGGSQCSFHTIQPIMRVFPFPSRRLRDSHLSVTGRTESALSARRAALERFLREVHGFFATFSNTLLRAKLQGGSCSVVGAFARFLQADVHFPLAMTGTLRQPLALQGWRQQCAERMLMTDESDELSGDRTTLAQAKAEQRSSVLLPELQVKPVKVATVHTFMEEFCEHVLSQYAHDIAELADPALTTVRKWEICLYVACRIGHTYAAQLILFNYADANAGMADGSTCLHIAARMGHADIVELLLDDGASVNRANAAGVTPLIAACRNGCVDVAKLLLRFGAAIDACSARGTYPLHAAIVSQNVEIVQLLVESGADVNAVTASGITPLHFAAKLGALEISEFLLQHHADVARRTKNDSDAMMIASANGHTPICELLQRFLPEEMRHRRSSAAVVSVGGALSDDAKPRTRSRQGSKAGEMVRLHSQRLTARQCA